MKDTEPVGPHLGKDEDEKDSPGAPDTETCIRILKSVEVGRELRCIWINWSKVYES